MIVHHNPDCRRGIDDRAPRWPLRDGVIVAAQDLGHGCVVDREALGTETLDSRGDERRGQWLKAPSYGPVEGAQPRRTPVLDGLVEAALVLLHERGEIRSADGEEVPCKGEGGCDGPGRHGRVRRKIGGDERRRYERAVLSLPADQSYEPL